ncbi:MAG: hypothetical protein ACRD9R_22165, partial [Pyrinomonadaceae bacterium]
ATDIALDAALATHRRAGALATLVLLPNPRRERYSAVMVDEGLVKGFGPYPEKSFGSDNAGGALRVSRNEEGNSPGLIGGVATEPGGQSAEGEKAPLMFTGIQILEPRIFEYIPRGVFSHSTTDVYPQAIARGEKIAAHVAAGYWYELSTIPRYLETSLALMRHEGRAVEHGPGAFVEDGADVSGAVLWENVRVEAGASVRRAVLGAGVRVSRGEVFEDTAVVRADLVESAEKPEKALAGERRGENFVVPLPR